MVDDAEYCYGTIPGVWSNTMMVAVKYKRAVSIVTGDMISIEVRKYSFMSALSVFVRICCMSVLALLLIRS